MKPILLAIDYSPASGNAADYAAQLAKAFNTSLVVLHTWTPPLMASEVGAPVLTVDYAGLQRDAVNAEASRISKEWNVSASGIERINFAASGIAEEFTQHEFSFVVMGMRKHSEVGRLLGSSATAKLHNANYPVLIIPEDVSYHKPKTILLATDLENTLDPKSVEVLKQISDQLEIVLHIVKVNEEKRLWDVSERNAGLQLIKNFPGIKYEWHFPIGEEVQETILEEAKSEEADWVVVAPHQLAWYEEMFHKSVSRKLAFSIDRPLLILPAK